MLASQKCPSIGYNCLLRTHTHAEFVSLSLFVSLSVFFSWFDLRPFEFASIAETSIGVVISHYDVVAQFHQLAKLMNEEVNMALRGSVLNCELQYIHYQTICA